MYISKKDLPACKKEHAFLLMNQYYEVDKLLGMSFCDKIGDLDNFKALTNKANQYIPTIGFAWKFAEFIFLERNFQKDRNNNGNKLRNVFAYPHPAWFLLNAQGTRFTNTKHKESENFAKEIDLEPLEYHLTRRTKGFSANIPYLKKICPNIYDINLAITKNQAQNAPNFFNDESIEAHIYIRRFDTKEIPDDEEKSAEWLQNLFREKDHFQQNFQKHGSFFHDLEPIEPITLKPRLVCLLNTVGWIFVTISFVIIYFGYLLVKGRFLTFSVGVAVLGHFYYLMNKTISYSQIEKS
ncbi:1-acyl-sn-glycerol-3-phosphate acyltransferase gamma-like [Culicoides brevitarsis]|uniref:1-acyl-sn-glycerol-3-phosphate acyltransferase gamma-like n=1 Tax=Culicoides brevitarsis TaxID=469753 RepID=UPI00307C4ADB